MKIFVTGGAGFIGCHVVDVLIEEGNEVSVLDNLSNGYREMVNEKSSFTEGDLMDLNKLIELTKGHDAVIHLAAEVKIDESIKNPKDFLERNIRGTINLLEAMRVNNIKKIVFSSSSAVYGETDKDSIKEDYSKKPLQPYGASKLACEAILSSYYNTFGINSVSLRYFNVYGPKDEVRPVTRAIPNWIKSCLNNKPLSIYWTGEQVRDFIFVRDVAKANLLSLKNCKGLKFYNVGSGEGIPVMTLLKEIIKISGKNPEIINLEERKGDPRRLVADISKIKEELGWKPEHSLTEGLKITYDYYKENLSSKENNLKRHKEINYD